MKWNIFSFRQQQMALLKLTNVSRATMSTSKKFRVDELFRANDLHLQSSEKRSWTILKRWARVMPLWDKTNISSGLIPHLLWNIFQHLMTSALSNSPSTENKSRSFSLWEYVKFSKSSIIFVHRLYTFYSHFMTDICIFLVPDTWTKLLIG